ncbi:MAG: hypothetical protein DSZ07_06065, partial [Sulfurovum sp.]
MYKFLKKLSIISIGLILLGTITFAEDTRILKFGDNLEFGSVKVGDSVTRDLILYNEGNATLNISKLRFHQRIQAVYAGDWSGAIEPGESQHISITFTPNEVKIYNGLLYVNSDRTNSGNYSRVLKGEGTPLDDTNCTKILTFGSHLKFGQVNIGETVTREITLYNKGTCPLTIEKFRFHDKIKDVFSGDFSGVIEVNGSKTATITFKPTENNRYSGLVYIQSDRTNGGEYSRALIGEGIDNNNLPVIALIGNYEVNITKDSAYSDAGATAIDDEDGDITSDINTTSNVDTSVIGTYEVRYNVKDSAGNIATEVVRTVRVIENTLPTSISGVITNFTTGTKLSNATVSVNGQETTTNAQGEYNLTNMAVSNRIVVSVSKDGYATNSEIASLSNTNQTVQDFNIALLPIAFTYELVDPTQEATIEVPNSPARLQLSANSLVQEDGSLPIGSIRILITPIDPTQDIDIMAGDMLTRNGANQLVPIESYGAVNIEMFDADNNPINLREGESATLRIPIFSRGGSIPNSIPLYYFDTTSGLWIEDGQATRNGDYYEGTVTRFTIWNADYLFDNVTINGCVEDTDGNLISNASIRLEGVNYNGQTYAYSNLNGQFDIIAKRDGNAILVAQKGVNTSSSKTITPSSDITLNECLVFGNSVQTQGLVAKLTWGSDPRDLDTHVVQEGGYHIYYSNKGDLNSPIYLAALDVDDTSSFGPEVFTAVAFPA